MQGGGLPGFGLLRGAAGVVGIDGRPLMLAFATCGGAALYFSLPFEPHPVHVWGVLGAAFVFWLAARRWSTSDTAITLSVILLGTALGLAAASQRAQTVAAPVILTATDPAMIEGWVQDIEPGRNGVRLLVRVHSIAGMAAEQTPKFVRLTHTSRLEVFPGRFVRCWSVLRPPPGPAMPGEYDFRRQAWFAELGAVGYVQGRCRGGTLGSHRELGAQAQLWLGAARRNLAAAVNEQAGQRAGGFAAALVSGDRSFMSEEDTEALRASGLSHIISISGLHLSILGGLVFLLVKRSLVFIEPIALRIAVQKPAAIAAILACLAYLVVSGGAVETQRSFVMAAIVFGAVIFDRAAISLRTFAIAMVAVVLLQPESVVSPGFQMSFAATGALIAAFEVWRNRRSQSDNVMGPIAFSWVSIIVTSVVAGLATMPYAIYHFDRATPIGLVANLAATPVITFLSAPAAACAFLLAPFGQSEIGLRLFGYSLEIVLWIGHFFAEFEGEVTPSRHLMPASAMILATFALGAGAATTGAARYILGGAFGLGAFIAWWSAPVFLAHWSPSGDLFVANRNDGITRLALVDADGLPPLRFADVAAHLCSAPICIVRTSQGAATYIRTGEEPKVCFKLGTATCLPDRSLSAPDWTWTEIMKKGGATAYLTRSGIAVRHPMPCGVRPWHPCPERPGPVHESTHGG